jgi:hypothetical protein
MKGKTTKNVPALKFPGPCPLMLFIEVRFREGKASGREEDREL